MTFRPVPESDDTTIAAIRDAERVERGRRWLIVLKLVARGDAPTDATPDDFTWDNDQDDDDAV